jgi:hypothetical protein
MDKTKIIITLILSITLIGISILALTPYQYTGFVRINRITGSVSRYDTNTGNWESWVQSKRSEIGAGPPILDRNTSLDQKDKLEEILFPKK